MQTIRFSTDAPTKPFHRHWQFCVGSGYAPLLLRVKHCKLIKQVHEELGIQRLRCHGIFCDEMNTISILNDLFPAEGGEEFIETSFRRCGEAYDNLLEAGVKPFVELSFMPKYLADEGHASSLFYQPNLAPPKDLSRWTQYLQKFLEFLFDRYGEEEVTQWYFEVWNEPDLPPFFHGSQRDYFRFYEATAKLIKQFNPKLQVGGPSTSAGKWVPTFLKYCEENHVPVDFITTHHYEGDEVFTDITNQKEVDPDYIPLPGKRRYRSVVGSDLPRDSILPAVRKFMGDHTEDRNITRCTFPDNVRATKANSKGLPVYYTEWNLVANLDGYCNDTRKGASYVSKMAMELDGLLDGSSIWCVDDFFEEHHQFPEEFHGGYGIITQSGIKKPVYHALSILANTGDNRYDIPSTYGNIDAAAFCGEKDIQVLLTRQSFPFAVTPERQPVSIEIAMKEKPQQVTLQRIDEDHCNPLKNWEDMGSPQVPNPKQLAQLQEQSALQTEPVSFLFENGVLKLSCSLASNDVYCFHIIY